MQTVTTVLSTFFQVPVSAVIWIIQAIAFMIFYLAKSFFILISRMLMNLVNPMSKFPGFFHEESVVENIASASNSNSFSIVSISALFLFVLILLFLYACDSVSRSDSSNVATEEDIQKESNVEVIKLNTRSLITQFSLSSIDLMSGHDFENELAKLYRKLGYRVRQTPGTRDFGADLILELDGDRIVVQVKHRSSSDVCLKGVQEIVAAIPHYKANRGIVITNRKFLPSAVELATSNKVKLIDRDELRRLINRANQSE